MPRIDEVARELGVSSTTVVEHLKTIGRPVENHNAAIDDELANRVRRELSDGAAPEGAVTNTMPASKLQQALDESIRGDRPVAGTATTTEPPPKPAGAPGAETPKKKKRKRPLRHQLIELPILVLIAFLIAVLVKTFVAQAFFIPSASMRPTLHEGDRVIVEKISYLFSEPERGDVIVFSKDVLGRTDDLPWYDDARAFLRELLGLPTGKEEDYIKRVVAVEGDTVRYEGRPRKLEINGEVIDESYIRGGEDHLSQPFVARDCRRFEMEVEGNGCLVPPNTVFVMGDNRNNSQDSRVIGPIGEDKVVGKAFIIIWPPGDFGGL
ncbi:MAG: signal peptidase I [Actinomycetota bacterium]